MTIDGVVLAGGLSTRMRGIDKALIEIDGKPLFRYAVENLTPHVQRIIVNSNRNQKYFQHLGFLTCDDGEFLHKGPLAGIYAAMSKSQADVVLVAPCDQLELPVTVYTTLLENVTQNSGAFATSDNQFIPTCAALPKSLLPNIKAALVADDLRLMRFISAHCRPIHFADVEFANLNHPRLKESP